MSSAGAKVVAAFGPTVPVARSPSGGVDVQIKRRGVRAINRGPFHNLNVLRPPDCGIKREPGVGRARRGHKPAKKRQRGTDKVAA